MNAFVTSVRDRLTAKPAVSAAPEPASIDQVVFDEELLARLRRLTLLSNRSISQGLAGEHRSQRRGSSPEFADFKSYSQGDDFRRIDWNIYSRLGELFVRLSEVTTELTVHMLLDASASMRWSGDPARATKFTYARRVAGSLGYVSLWHFDRLMITPFAEQLGQPFGPSHGRSHITPMLKFLTDLPATGADIPRFGDQLHALQRGIVADREEEGMLGVELARRAAAERRREVEPEAVDSTLVRPVAQRVEDESLHRRP